MLEDFKVRLARYIGRRRQWPVIRAAHQVASYFENAYDNDEWDMAVNGELAVVQKLATARFTTVIDAGAHVGDWSVAALAAWREATVHAFEVAPQTFERLTKKIDAAGLSTRTVLNPVGLSDATGVREMFYFPEHPNLTCDQPRHDQFRAVAFEGRMVDGDTYVREHGLTSVDFLKIDVEGAEHFVLKGFRETIAAGRVQCIQFEYGAFSIQTHVLLGDYYQLLAPHFWIGKIYPTYVDFQDYHWRMENFRFCNMLCVARHRQDLLRLLSA